MGYYGAPPSSALQVDSEHGVSREAHRHALYHRAGRAGRHDGPPAGPPKGGVYRPRHAQEASKLCPLSPSHRGNGQHPDPKEVNLQLLAKVMKLMLDYYKKHIGIGTFAVFFE